ncbi:hypothetical protein C0Q70_05072 [Pomacea canaliculata]|uniref:Uncharacterized protein n=1 Tax=Pomacea canaliculata TaxID=400727 RepID=A0A2T7PK49_POMCA|nr:hypothetical protein C0Q70_05072 [Pomacea canaliculata]
MSRGGGRDVVRRVDGRWLREQSSVSSTNLSDVRMAVVVCVQWRCCPVSTCVRSCLSGACCVT